MRQDRIAILAEEILTARNDGRQIPAPSGSEPGFDMEVAHQIAARIRTLRAASGETVIGRKIGFTNRTIWDTYGVHAPIWGDMFDTTVQRLESMPAAVSLPPLPEMRLEPEIVFGFATAPEADMDDAALLDCIDWVAHGVEIVSPLFSGWQFSAADVQAAFGLHGALFVGPAQSLVSLGEDPKSALSELEITLTGPGTHATGYGRDVLDGPVQALRHFLTCLEDLPYQSPLTAGDMVTTGTLTDAMPVEPGQTWRTEFANLPLTGMHITFTA